MLKNNQWTGNIVLQPLRFLSLLNKLMVHDLKCFMSFSTINKYENKTHSLHPAGYFQSQQHVILQRFIMPIVYSIRSFRRFCTARPIFHGTVGCATNPLPSVEYRASPVKIIMSWNVFGLPFYIIIKIFNQSKEK